MIKAVLRFVTKGAGLLIRAPTSVDGENGVPLVTFLVSTFTSPPPSTASNSSEVTEAFFGVMLRSSSALLSSVATSESDDFPGGLRTAEGVRGDCAPEGVGDVPNPAAGVDSGLP